MKMFNKFQSPLGYQVTDDLIDTYGVDHSNFSARDEVEYQFARQNIDNTAGNIPIVPFVKKAKQGYNTVKKLI